MIPTIKCIFKKTFHASRMMFSFGRREPFHKLIVEGTPNGRYCDFEITVCLTLVFSRELLNYITVAKREFDSVAKPARQFNPAMQILNQTSNHGSCR